MHNESAAQITREKQLPNTAQEIHTRTALHDAASAGDEKLLESLLVGGADRNVKESQYGNTPLHESAWKGYSRCVKILCSLPKLKVTKTESKDSKQDTKGALHSTLLGTRNFGGFSALHLASQNGHNQCCREILLAGGDPDVQNNYGDTPLHTACRYGHAGAIRILLSAKCDYERINLNGDTSLHIACAMGRRKLTRILLEAGCKQNTQNAQNETPRDIVTRKNLNEILNILNTPLQQNRNVRDRSSSSSQQNANIDMSGKSKDKTKNKHDVKYDVDPKHWSPYGCHYFPDPRNFPSPKLETLPKEPLLTGEQYYLDLAGNICKGPVGVGNTCYCAPFFKHLEQRMNQNRKSIKKYVHRATEKIDSKVNALASRTDDQIEELTKSMIANRVRCENKRLHLEQWLKRGVMTRSTAPHTSKSKKDEANTNTLTRCRSLDLLDGNEEFPQKIKTSTPQFSRSTDFLDETHINIDPHIPKDIEYSDHFESSTNSNIRNHSDMGEDRRRSSENHYHSKRSSSISQISGKESFNFSDKDNDKEKGQRIYNKANSSNFGGNSSKEDRKVMSKNTSATSSGYEQKYEKIKVTERLEELLSKTKKILELEKIAKKSHQQSKFILALDKLQKGEQDESSRNSPTYISKIHKPYDIAQEMEKITQSLLKNKGNTTVIPTSPEILKEIPLKKEKSKYLHKNEKSGSSVSPCSLMSPSSSLLGGDKDHLSDDNIPHMVSSNFLEDALEEIESEIGPEANFTNGFYANTCFEDLPSSSNTTIRSNSNPAEQLEALDREQVDGGTDDECDISDMAKFSELKELKSRILNGTNWRSQVLQKSVQDLFKTATNEKHEFQFPIEQDQEVSKYEIRNSEIKVLKQSGDEQDLQQEETFEDEDDSHLNRVQYIISKLQNESLQSQTGIYQNGLAMNESENSNDEDDDNEENQKMNAKSLIQRFEHAAPNLFIPKDAYFHELPNRNPRTNHEETLEHMQISKYARNRNPLPTYLNENEIFSRNELNDEGVSASGFNEVPLPPYREKLLSSRKYNQMKVNDDYLMRSQDDINDSGYISTKVSEQFDPSATSVSTTNFNRLENSVNSSSTPHYEDLYNLGASSLV